MRIVDRHHCADFFTRVKKILVPVGLSLIDVKVRVVVERNLERAGFADMPLCLAQPAFEIAPFFPRELGVFEFFQNLVEFLFRHFARSEQDQLLAGLACNIKEGAVIGTSFRIPGDNGQPLKRAGMAPEYREIGAFEVVENFAFECFEVEIHDMQIQNSTGPEPHCDCD